jgi:hypothetical protein
MYLFGGWANNPSKGYHTTRLRTIFGTITVNSPCLRQCPCQSHPTKTCSPLAELLPEHLTPELLFLETKWAALASYGVTAQLLQDVLPIDEPLHAFTIRQHVYEVGERLEQALGEEQWSFIDSCPVEWSRLPIPNGPLTVGIDGGYVGAQGKQDGQSGDQQALLQEAADGLDATRRTPAAADTDARLEWRLGGHISGVVSGVPCLPPANGSVTPQNQTLSTSTRLDNSNRICSNVCIWMRRKAF